MLARWVSPVRGLIPPDEFIPVAEETGMIGDLSLSIIRKAMMEAKHWDPKLTISVNISPVQLKDPWLAQKIVKLLVETGFPGKPAGSRNHRKLVVQKPQPRAIDCRQLEKPGHQNCARRFWNGLQLARPFARFAV